MTTIRVSRKKLLIIAIICLALGLIGINLQSMLNSLGHRELYEIAHDKGYCKSESCEEGIKVATEFLSKKSGISQELVPWCMAANKIHFMNFYLLDPVKNKFTEWMYKRCANSNLTLDDANISIGEPHDHDD